MPYFFQDRYILSVNKIKNTHFLFKKTSKNIYFCRYWFFDKLYQFAFNFEKLVFFFPKIYIFLSKKQLLFICSTRVQSKSFSTQSNNINKQKECQDYRRMKGYEF